MADVTLSNVVKTFGAVDVIHGLDLSVSDGEFVVFVGPSGCGKSTLLRMIAGLEDISDGEIAIGGTWSTTSRRLTAARRWCSRPTRSIRT